MNKVKFNKVLGLLERRYDISSEYYVDSIYSVWKEFEVSQWMFLI